MSKPGGTVPRTEVVAFLRRLGVDTNAYHLRLKFSPERIDVKADGFVRNERGLVEVQPSGEGLLRRHQHFVVDIVEEVADEDT